MSAEVREPSAKYLVQAQFKDTEIGPIPSDWEIKRLRDVSPNQSVGLVINPSTYFDLRGTVPMLVGSNVTENRIDWEGARRIARDSNERLPASRVYTDDLVTVRVGDPGVTAVVSKEYSGSNCASMMIVRSHPSFDSDWLCYLMNSSYGRSRIQSVQYGTAQKQFNISDAVEFKYPVPPLLEQRAIATALTQVDALIAGLEKLIAKKRDLKQAAMQQLLTGQTRLPGFSGEWRNICTGDIGHFRGGNGFPNIQHGDLVGDYPFYKVSDMNIEGNGTFMSDANNWISEATRNNLGATAFPVDTIIFAKVGAAVFLERKKILTRPSCIDNNLAALVLDKSIAVVRFVHYALLHIWAQSALAGHVAFDCC